VLGAENAVRMRQAHDQPEELLVIQAAIPDQAYRHVRKEGVGDTDGSLDLPVLAHKIQHVAEPVSVGDRWHRQVHDGGSDGRIATGQAFLAIQGRRRTLHDG
jgi:hypothetical protein